MPSAPRLRFCGADELLIDAPADLTDPFWEALLAITPHARVQRGDHSAQADNFGVVVLRMWVRPGADRVSLKFRLDRLDRAAVEAACRTVSDALVLAPDALEGPRSLVRRALRRLISRIPPGRWGR